MKNLDMAPHFEAALASDSGGGLVACTNIPSFRLPESVLQFETDAILEMGVDIRYNSPVNSMKNLLDEGFDAIFVGSGAPRGKDLDTPGRHDTDPEEARIHIGIDWLESIAFGHTSNIGQRVLKPAQIAASVVTKDGKPKYPRLHALRHFYASWCINRRQDGGLELPPNSKT